MGFANGDNVIDAALPVAAIISNERLQWRFINLKGQAWWLPADWFRHIDGAITGKEYDPAKIICSPCQLAKRYFANS
jgi:hypothetical protein